MSAIADRLRNSEGRAQLERFICLTFDDGFVDIYAEAFAVTAQASFCLWDSSSTLARLNCTSPGQELPTNAPVSRRQWWPREIARLAIA
jgi:hypothetical protein